jgi:hypothetical protein
MTNMQNLDLHDVLLLIPKNIIQVNLKCAFKLTSANWGQIIGYYWFYPLLLAIIGYYCNYWLLLAIIFLQKVFLSLAIIAIWNQSPPPGQDHTISYI